MHMADALLSPGVGGAMCAVSAGALVYSAVKMKGGAAERRKLPIMAVAGAFVFAAQMINFTIPGTGSSGHIGGGVLLAGLLGGPAALLTIAAVLVIQCLMFADGGLLALGCNIFNMGVLPCLVVYPLVFQRLFGKKKTKGRLMAASVLSAVVGLQLGAFGVVLETTASGITALPFSTFVLLMQPIHLAIGLVEGIVTGGVLMTVYAARPELLDGAEDSVQPRPVWKTAAVLALAAVLVAGGLSLAASGLPDGLEWAMEKTAGTAELEAQGAVLEKAAEIQEKTAQMPDYAAPVDNEQASTSLAGVLGAGMTFLLAGGVGGGIVLVKRRRNRKTEQERT